MQPRSADVATRYFNLPDLTGRVDEMIAPGRADKRTAAVWADQMPKGFPSDLAKTARRKLRVLDAAVGLEDLRQPPGNHLEPLKGNREGQHSIRVNDQWRLCFERRDDGVHGLRSWTTTEDDMAIRIEDVGRLDFSDVATGDRIGPVTAGDVLREEFMAPLKLSARALARDMGVPSNRITAILSGDRGVTAETALLLSARLGTSAEFWMHLQVQHDLEEARRHTHRAA
jgi:addiction module HigA family antidote